mmetsp:Transcript_12588/g.30884  ORF Transcript_12588/g.30884 Transcript_12588/m.30884 type:complete len:273 (-) Transcript_12588:212-1030(-)|eukprot:CAMPEP_0202867076 /NCGR_PEP_ID=MMETSP1391-20130828/8629_1 /ASSEMBLY_ACC=CAM_ASM_000867 /TAXON_ID=1034604 /ORGANISM="Chlamydomonas leiostraca, Strain SAG 11-49" /LENGTH=272 /DNA_ID=CAMNT_0049547081 /DNA_START=47 /DNA_END=865 /DNA_ORIENTATION=+
MGALVHFCLVVLVGVLGVNADSLRRLYIRDIPKDANTCSNTVQGLRIIADSKGLVCSRPDVDPQTGCCKTGSMHTCDKCTLADKCCAEYEHCVSCCLAPQHEAEKLYKTTLKAPKHPGAGKWGSAWEYCAGVCRTHGRSTVHENAYIASRHHCFSQLARPMLSEPLAPDALKGVEVVMSNSDETCDAACSRRGKRCSSKHLAILNTCDRLREQVGCEAGCESFKLAGGSAPGYVDGAAPKASRPAMCFTAPSSSSSSCSAKDQHVHRICSCT